jgi:hypothetical protein
VAVSLIVLFPTLARSECLTFSEAAKHIGRTACVSGKVLRVEAGERGTHFLDFCEDYRVCPFTVVVFAGDLKQVGDIRQLEGKQVEIHGEIKQYDGRAEIILQRPSQLRGDGARIPPLPKEYDVERKGKYSAGTLKYPNPPKRAKQKKQPAPVGIEDPSQPWTPAD